MELKLSTKTLRRFWEKIEVSEANCWIWTGSFSSSRGPKGDRIPCFHGGQNPNGRSLKLSARKLAYFLAYGSYPGSLRSTCENGHCVNPAHLFAKDEAEELYRGYETRSYQKLTEKTILRVINLAAAGMTQGAIEIKTGLHRHRIGAILRMSKLCREGKLTPKKVAKT